MQQALVAVLHLMLGDEQRLSTGVWRWVRGNEMGAAWADALLPSSAACAEAQAMSGVQARWLELRMMGHEEVLQAVRLFGRLAFAP